MVFGQIVLIEGHFKIKGMGFVIFSNRGKRQNIKLEFLPYCPYEVARQNEKRFSHIVLKGGSIGKIDFCNTVMFKLREWSSPKMRRRVRQKDTNL